jgi:protein-S-isoprenylcysteine O-methyltransferase Ste14
MSKEASAGPGIHLPPPVIYLAALVIGSVLDYQWPLSPLLGSSRYVVGSIIALAGGLIMPPVLVRFRRSGTTIDVRKPATALITEGPYRFSRNPIYVSLTLLYLGIGTLLNNAWILILVAPVFLVMNLWVVSREERHLEATFGEEFLRYKAAVRRWL